MKIKTIQSNTILGFHAAWGNINTEKPVLLPAGKYADDGNTLTPMLDSGEPSAKHSYVLVQQLNNTQQHT